MNIELDKFKYITLSTMSFRALVAFIDTMPKTEQIDAIEYADEILKTWPDSVRLAPWSWCKSATKGFVTTSWKLIRTLELYSKHLTKGSINLAKLAHHVDTKQITELRIPSYSDFQENSLLYHHPELFPSLKKLYTSDKYDDGDIKAVANSPLWRSLEFFEISDLKYSIVNMIDSSRFCRFN